MKLLQVEVNGTGTGLYQASLPVLCLRLASASWLVALYMTGCMWKCFILFILCEMIV